ncbi:MFS transporter [Actinospica robiniae]|uniref:MFS transporter n=1 Tax=Actinospica robiniae TaxID=304901 RepID=UPI000553F4A4|nr:MFS transporter [Actinospica robiniae]
MSNLSAPPYAARWSPRLWGMLAVLCAAMFLDAMDVSMVGVALPSIRTELHLNTSTLQWVVSGYVLGYGGFLMLGGRCADLLGRRRVFLVALGVFAVASLVGAVATAGSLLVVSRVVKGVTAGFTAPAGLSIITTSFAEGPQRNRAFSIYTTCAAAGFSLGLVLSGLLTELSWRWTFLFPAPIALIALVAGYMLVPRDASDARPARRGFDAAGAITVTAGLLLVVYAVSDAPNAGWASTRTIGSLVAAAALLAAFIVIELKVANPLLRLGLLRSPALAAGNIAGFIFMGTYTGYQFIATLYLQSVLGWSALEMAFAFLPAGVLVALCSTRIGRLMGRFGPAKLSVLGFVLLAGCYANLLRMGEHDSYAGLVLPSVALVGLSFALVFPSLTVQATNGVAAQEQGMASGLVNASFQIGGAVLLAAVSAVVSAESGAGSSASAQLRGYRPGLAVDLGIALVGLLIALTVAVLERRPRATQATVGAEADASAAEPAPVAGT